MIQRLGEKKTTLNNGGQYGEEKSYKKENCKTN